MQFTRAFSYGFVCNSSGLIHRNKTSEKCYGNFYAYSDNSQNLLLIIWCDLNIAAIYKIKNFQTKINRSSHTYSQKIRKVTLSNLYNQLELKNHKKTHITFIVFDLPIKKKNLYFLKLIMNNSVFFQNMHLFVRYFVQYGLILYIW